MISVIVASYHRDHMELRHLRYFLAVAEELSFRRAAAKLHVAQPSLSSQIRQLEEEIQVRLLERDTHRMSLVIVLDGPIVVFGASAVTYLA